MKKTTHELFTAHKTLEGCYQLAVANMHKARRNLEDAQHHAEELEAKYLAAHDAWLNAVNDKTLTGNQEAI